MLTKQKLILLTSILLSIIYAEVLQGQVTIGTNELPAKGALLQLKNIVNVTDGSPNATKGLILPRVALKDTKTIISVISGVDNTNSADHVGLVVFNVTDNIVANTVSGVCPGVYIWEGLEWIRLEKRCCAPPVIKTQPNTTEVYVTDINGAVTPITVNVSGTNLTYQWQVAPMTQPLTFTDIPEATSSSYTPLTSDYGYNLYQCVIKNECGVATTSQARIIVGCGAYIAAGEWKVFMCYNLGADESLNPYNIAKGLNGSYYQWGRITETATVDTDAAAIAGWNTIAAADGAWLDESKTTNDPCPAGWRIPTKTDFDGLVNGTLNPQTRVGSSNSNWVASVTNFSTGRKFGKALYLPAAGLRSNTNGQLADRGGYGHYWTTTPTGTTAYRLNLNFVGAGTGGANRNFGYSVRCIQE